MIDKTAFERYRRSSHPASLPRLLVGTAIIVACWVATTVAVLGAALYLYDGASTTRSFLESPAGILSALATFAGIWLGAWLTMRWVHGEHVGALLGTQGGVSWSGFLKGLIAVLLTSLLSEILLYWLQPGISRSHLDLSSWLLFLIPVAALTLLQASAEEVLFRGYLLRGLASRFRSPLLWALLPGLLFVSLHFSPASSASINACVLVSIAAFAGLLTLLVYATGNLGAAFGAHLGNNLTGFLLISHQESYNSFALFNAAPLEGPGWTTSDAIFIAAIGIVSSLLTLLLLLHARSPLRLVPDAGLPAGQADQTCTSP